MYFNVNKSLIYIIWTVRVFVLKDIMNKILGSYGERQIRKIRPMLSKIETLDCEMMSLTDIELKNKTEYFKDKLANGSTLEDILPEAFAVVREASHRVLKMKHFPVQILGGIVIHQGRIAEMKTGEGKTFVATLPAYLNALSGKGVHIITVNDYLAKRDSEWMGKVYRFLGLSVGLITHEKMPHQRRQAYDADITYGTNHEFGFDYLRDNMVLYKTDMVQRGHNYVIVDEVDSILIDEARTPLIISGPGDKSTQLYDQTNQFVRELKYVKFAKTDHDEDNEDIEEYDYIIDEKSHSATLTATGVSKAEETFGIDNLSDIENITLNHHIQQALKAHGIMKKDKDYVVKEGQIIIVDEFTGRLMFGRRYNDGLHQAIEAKEEVRIESESKTLATITFQNYFRMYSKLAGMTGTALTEEDEFQEIYKLDVVCIPENKLLIRIDNNDLVYKNQTGKFKAVVNKIKECNEKGQPVLVGTISIEKSEQLSTELRKAKIDHQVLNAKFHEQEAEIVSQAGKFGAVTIATNMAGRGTDILLGGNPEFMALKVLKDKTIDESLITDGTSHAETDDPAVLKIRKQYADLYSKFKEETDKAHELVIEQGGLCIIGTERHESRRIDNQLRGRSGRQGDVGETQFFLSLEDDLMRIFGSDRAYKTIEMIGGLEEDEPLEARILSKTIENAQKKVELRNFNTRKYVVQYDDIINKQREIIYKQRRQVLENSDLKKAILFYIDLTVKGIIENATQNQQYADGWNWNLLIEQLWDTFGVTFKFSDEERQNILKEDLLKRTKSHVLELYEQKEVEFGLDKMRELERVVLLQIVDQKWIDHIDSVEHMKSGIGLRAYGQRDPIVEFKFETMNMFKSMTDLIRTDTVKHIYAAQPSNDIQRIDIANLENLFSNSEKIEIMTNSGNFDSNIKNNIKNDINNIEKKVSTKKEGRNELCSCGSGKKHKKCCGANLVK